MNGITLGRRKVDNAGAGAADDAALGGPVEHEFHELQRLQRDVEIGHRNRLVVAGRARHEVQAQLLIAAVLRTGFAAELRDREQAHFERFQRSVHIDALVGGQRNRDVAPSVSEIHIERRRAVTPANAEQIAHREKRMRSDEHAAGAKEAVLGQALDDAIVFWSGGRAAER